MGRARVYSVCLMNTIVSIRHTMKNSDSGALKSGPSVEGMLGGDEI